ncbi:MAG: hypothetical protein LUF85_17575 [Bacteroides sp.]|nr:hypothetical protein [Bacteroides sp.]
MYLFSLLRLIYASSQDKPAPLRQTLLPGRRTSALRLMRRDPRQPKTTQHM